ncbi:MAG: hypothetical protein HZA81_01980 [Candidatus Taylorbacteria bacterium]|nr:hypothetical protein [Candidatus Taylorbacteria bacterium]
MTQYVQERVEKMERPVIAWSLLGAIFALLLCYAYFINGAVSNMVAAKALRGDILALTSKAGSIEAEYMAKKSSIDLAYAHSLGYKESSDAVYVAKRPTAPLSFNR